MLYNYYILIYYLVGVLFGKLVKYSWFVLYFSILQLAIHSWPEKFIRPCIPSGQLEGALNQEIRRGLISPSEGPGESLRGSCVVNGDFHTSFLFFMGGYLQCLSQFDCYLLCR